jgi:hypothetical protein
MCHPRLLPSTLTFSLPKCIAPGLIRPLALPQGSTPGRMYPSTKGQGGDQIDLTPTFYLSLPHTISQSIEQGKVHSSRWRICVAASSWEWRVFSPSPTVPGGSYHMRIWLAFGRRGLVVQVWTLESIFLHHHVYICFRQPYTPRDALRYVKRHNF